ncbi:unnamed protein product [Blumeria hordei]|uniref:Early meiotic induction protein 1 n=1 Tax=Blumeria hordei TaxID=2867405 RepID=A0A383UXJ1_BLUHO|nr:unnamed protein product [Blumeria hordei]
MTRPWATPTSPSPSASSEDALKNTKTPSSDQNNPDAADTALISIIAEVSRDSSNSQSSESPVPSNPESLQRLGPIAEHLLPTTMSCRDAFDSAFYCTSLGGAFTHLYRYGTVRSCNEHWNKFWFCMRTRTYGDTAKQAAIKEYYRTVENSKYGKRGTSSEDIWRSRDELLDPGMAFRGDGQEWTGSDEEWRMAVLDVRKKIREVGSTPE